MDVVVRVLVMASIAVGYHLTRGIHSLPETFAMSVVAVATGHAAALVVRFLRRDPRITGSHALAATLLSIAVLGAGIALIVTRPRKAGPLPFVQVHELAGHHGEEVKLHGIVEPHSLVRRIEAEESVTRFSLVEGDARVAVQVTGPLPDTMRDGAEIVARGRLDGELFVATEVSAKCPDTYQTADGPVPAARFRK